MITFSPDIKVLHKLANIGFAPLIVITVGLMSIDAVSYPGFLTKTIGVSSSFFLFCSALAYALLLFHTVITNEPFSPETQLVLRANAVIFPLALLISYLFSQLEAMNYPNYVYSTFHINLAQTDRLTLLSTFLFFLHIFKDQFTVISATVKKQPDPKVFLGSIIFYVFALLFVSFQLLQHGTRVAEDLAKIAKRPFSTFADRKREVFGTSYDLYSFINQHTPPDAVIAVPPQNRWGIIGNIGFSRYFLHPRFLVHPEDRTPQQLQEIDYYITASEYLDVEATRYAIWPTYNLNAAEIIIFNELQNTFEYVDQTEFIPTDPQYKGTWALVKLRK